GQQATWLARTMRRLRYLGLTDHRADETYERADAGRDIFAAWIEHVYGRPADVPFREHQFQIAAPQIVADGAVEEAANARAVEARLVHVYAFAADNARYDENRLGLGSARKLPARV